MKSLIRSALRNTTKIPLIKNTLRALSSKGMVSPRLMIRLPIEGAFSVSINQAENFLYSASYGDGVGRMLHWGGAGGFEPETIALFDKLARNAKIFADIGANTGHFSLYACAVNPDLQIYSFEPVPRTFQAHSKNLELNSLQTRCHPQNMAMGTQDGEVSFHVPYDDVPTSASLNQQGFNDIPGDLITVPITRFDTFFKDKTPPDLIKIDVEGFEDKVLEGMQGLFEANYRPLIIFESNPGGPEEQIDSILKSLGYELFHLQKTGPKKADKLYSEPKAHHERNWLAVPAGQMENLKLAA
ncbi:FkbM family methyltransferase [Alphaproteobacteria bacterium]|nr:FkbM family methyltransferase [Alphaproteobacteria bacterium]